MRDWKTLIEAHEDAYKAHEKPARDKALRYFNGDFTGSSAHEELSLKHRLSYNLIYVVVESAQAALQPSNPKLSATADGPSNPQHVRDADAVVNLALRLSKMRREAGMAITNAVLYGWSAFKTTRGRDSRGRVRAIKNLWFDLAATRVEDIRYFIEPIPTALSTVKRKMKRRGNKTGLYKKVDTEGSAYPKWIRDQQTADAQRRLEEAEKWVMVYECYDMEEGRVVHLVGPELTEVLNEPLTYRPYTVFNLLWNGKDLRGLSEVQLILSLQEEVNALLSCWLQIAHLQVTKTGFDSRALDIEEVAKMAEAGLGSYVPLKVGDGRSLADVFAALPIPAMTSEQFALLEKVEQIISTVSALSEAARGQVTGAKTATEIALIDGQMRTRLGTRIDNFGDAMSDVGANLLTVIGRYGGKVMVPEEDGATGALEAAVMQLQKAVVAEDPALVEQALVAVGEAQSAANDGWREVNSASLKDAAVRFELVPFNPLRSNSAIQAETFLSVLPHLHASERVDQRKVDERLLEIADLDPGFLLDEDQLAAQQAAQQAPGGALAANDVATLEAANTTIDPTAQPVSPQAAANLPSEQAAQEAAALGMEA